MRTLRSSLTAVAAVALAASSLAGCGGSENSAYCKDLKSDKAYFDSFNGSNPDISKLDDAFKRMHALADEAPDAVSDEWKTLDEALTTIDKALKDAGVSFADIAKMQQGQTPKGVDMAKLQALAPKLQSLGDAKFSKASKAIAKNAKSECNVNLT
jgi:hypothetical protein